MLVATLAAGCSASRGVAPLGAGNGAITSSIGGPLVEYAGAPIAVPIGSLGYAHGVSDKSNVHAALYPTLIGAPGADLGVATELRAPGNGGPRLMADAMVYAFTGSQPDGTPQGGTRVFPDLQLIAAWPTEKRTGYLGIDQFFQPGKEFHYYVSPMLGGELRAGRVGFVGEWMWLAWTKNNTDGVPRWYGIGGQGAMSIHLGLNVYVGGRP